MKKKLFDTSIILTLVICAFLAYSNTFDASFHYDDNISIVFNESVQMEEFSLGRLLRSHTPGYPFDRPLAWMSFSMNYYFGGLDPFGYHLVNIIIHMFTGIGVYLLIKAIMGLSNPPSPPFVKAGAVDRSFVKGDLVAAMAAALWLLSPVQTQSVTYIVQRMTSMATMFYVFSLLFYILWRTGKGGVVHLLVSISLFLAALATKQIGLTLPLVLLLFEFSFFGRDPKGRFRVFSMMFIFILLAAALLSLADLRPGHFFRMGYAMQERVFTGARVIIHYISILFFPVPSRLALLHDFPLSRGLLTPLSTLPALCFIIGAGLLSIYRIRRDPLVSFFILWFFINILPETLYPRIELIYEHRLYLSSIGFYAVFACLIYRMLKERTAGFVLVLSALFLINTYNRNRAWHDDVSLWSDNAKKSPILAISHEGLGRAYLNIGELEKAEEELKTAKRLNPLSSLAGVGLGIVYQRKGDIGRAIRELEYVVSRRRMGTYVYYHGMEGDMYKMEKALLEEGRSVEAEKVFRLWLELKPESEDIEGLPKLKIAR